MNLFQISNKTPKGIKAVVEIPKNSYLKYEYDSLTEQVIPARKWNTTRIPYNYGFIPKTISPDGDCLDVIFWSEEIIYPLSVVTCSFVGVLEMIDGGVRDDKIIVSPFFEGRVSPNIGQIPLKTSLYWLDFIRASKEENKKEYEILGFKDKSDALATFALCDYDTIDKNSFLG